ncbi:hypothetical protein IC229_30875 [Spirosoma sp. BT702]|uniref:Uncharacterized protein n=1 Tax=Spirosoma profusum TaxID=2771354 RepID=A0A927GAF6_9BACT|nr:hypothetical protein [Spirosoma profusum]MBD2705070.1 hypothetical protein [Spirosoma profusum]
MAPESPLDKDAILLVALRHELVIKLQEDWDVLWKPRGHGDSFSTIANLPNQARFLSQLFEDIYDTLTNHFESRAAANDYMIDHERTLARFLSESYTKGFSLKTRNTIATYVGYRDYADFVRQYRETHEPPPSVTVVSLLPVPIRRELVHLPRYATTHRPWKPLSLRRKLFWWVVLSVLLLAWFIWGYQQYRQLRYLTASETAAVVFREVGRNAPTNPCWVRFEYDFSALGLDSLMLHYGGSLGAEEESQRSITRPKGNLSVAFYKGGIKLMTLRHRDQIIKRIIVMVPSDNWGCFVGGPDWTHPDFTPRQYYRDNCLFVNPDISIIDPKIRSYFMTHLYKAHHWSIDMDSLTAECRIQNKPDAFGISCFDTRLTFADTKVNQFAIEFRRPGCLEFTTQSGDTLLPQPLPDRKAFEVSFPKILDRFYNVKVVLANGVATTYMDGKLVSRNPYRHSFNHLRQLEVKFKGSGKIDFFRLTNSYTGQPVYTDDFGGPAVD